MPSITRLTLLTLATVVCAGGATTVARAQAEDRITVDDKLADQGGKLWKIKACDGCHTIGGGRRAAPDLMGATARRSASWLREWLKNPPEMAKSDEVAKQMVKEAGGSTMPNFRLKDEEIEALLSFIARRSEKP